MAKPTTDFTPTTKNTTDVSTGNKNVTDVATPSKITSDFTTNPVFDSSSITTWGDSNVSWGDANIFWDGLGGGVSPITTAPTTDFSTTPKVTTDVSEV